MYHIFSFLGKNNTVHSTHTNSTCWGTDYHFRMILIKVNDGTECGPGCISLQMIFVPVPLWEGFYWPNTCNKTDICSNKYHCHCTYGWAQLNSLKKAVEVVLIVAHHPRWLSCRFIYFYWFGLLIFCSSLLIWLFNEQDKSHKNIETT